jgi:hypothetical protein
MFPWLWAESEQAHQRVLSPEPTNAFPHMVYPILCSFLGRDDETFHAAKAVELDPLDLMTNLRLVQANGYAGRQEEAVRCGRIAIDTRLALHLFLPGLFFGAIACKSRGLGTCKHGPKACRWYAPCRDSTTAAILTTPRISARRQLFLGGIRAGRSHYGRRRARGSLSREYPASA